MRAAGRRITAWRPAFRVRLLRLLRSRCEAEPVAEWRFIAADTSTVECANELNLNLGAVRLNRGLPPGMIKAASGATAGGCCIAG